jgi:hypothetical protein
MMGNPVGGGLKKGTRENDRFFRLDSLNFLGKTVPKGSLRKSLGSAMWPSRIEDMKSGTLGSLPKPNAVPVEKPSKRLFRM